MLYKYIVYNRGNSTIIVVGISMDDRSLLHLFYFCPAERQTLKWWPHARAYTYIIDVLKNIVNDIVSLLRTNYIYYNMYILIVDIYILICISTIIVHLSIQYAIIIHISYRHEYYILLPIYYNLCIIRIMYILI